MHAGGFLPRVTSLIVPLCPHIQSVSGKAISDTVEKAGGQIGSLNKEGSLGRGKKRKKENPLKHLKSSQA